MLKFALLRFTSFFAVVFILGVSILHHFLAQLMNSWLDTFEWQALSSAISYEHQKAKHCMREAFGFRS